MNRQCNLSLCVSYCKVLKPLAPEKRSMQWNKMSQWNMSIKSFLQNESFKMSLKQVEFTSRVVFKHSVPQHIPCSIIWSYLPVQEWTIIVLHPVWIFFLFFFFYLFCSFFWKMLQMPNNGLLHEDYVQMDRSNWIAMLSEAIISQLSPSDEFLFLTHMHVYSYSKSHSGGLIMQATILILFVVSLCILCATWISFGWCRELVFVKFY